MICPNDPAPLPVQPEPETKPDFDTSLITLDESYWRFVFEDWEPAEEDFPIHPAKVAEIERLLTGGENSQQQIARQTDVDPAVIAAIAHRMRRGSLAGEPESPAATSRCPRCGGRATLPCRVCLMR